MATTTMMIMIITTKGSNPGDRTSTHSHISVMSCIIVLTNYSWLQIHKHSPGHMLASSGLTEKGIEGVISASDGFVARHLTIGLDTVLQAVQLPACISNLDTGLSNVDTNALTLWEEKETRVKAHVLKHINININITMLLLSAISTLAGMDKY